MASWSSPGPCGSSTDPGTYLCGVSTSVRWTRRGSTGVCVCRTATTTAGASSVRPTAGPNRVRGVVVGRRLFVGVNSCDWWKCDGQRCSPDPWAGRAGDGERELLSRAVFRTLSCDNIDGLRSPPRLCHISRTHTHPPRTPTRACMGTAPVDSGGELPSAQDCCSCQFETG